MPPITPSRRFAPVLCAALCALGVAHPSQAQGVVSAAEIAVLQKAMAPLVDTPALGTESDLEITAGKGGMTLNVHEHLKIVAKKPGKFRAEVSLLPSGNGAGTASGAGETYVVTSNGTRVLTFQPSVQQYSLVPVATFNAANDDMPTLGLFVGPLYLGDQSFAGVISLFSKGNTPTLLAALKKQGLGLTSKPQTVDDVNFTVFTLSIARFGAYHFYVDTATGTLSRMSLNGVQGGLTITMLEKITSRNPTPAITPATFQLTPPAGARKVKYVPIGSF